MYSADEKMKKTAMKVIRAAIDRFLRVEKKKSFSVIGNTAFNEANLVLDSFVKDLRKSGKIAGTVHKKSITAEQIQLLFYKGQLGPANSRDPAQLQRTVWFYVSFFFGKRGRENQRQLEKSMLVLRKTPTGREYFELNRAAPGAILPTKNHQCGLAEDEDESDGKIFSFPSAKCPVETIKNYLHPLNPDLPCLFQRPKSLSSNNFNPDT